MMDTATHTSPTIPLTHTELVFELSGLCDAPGMRQHVYGNRYRVVPVTTCWLRVYDHAHTPPVEADFSGRDWFALLERVATWLIERGVE